MRERWRKLWAPFEFSALAEATRVGVREDSGARYVGSKRSPGYERVTRARSRAVRVAIDGPRGRRALRL